MSHDPEDYFASDDHAGNAGMMGGEQEDEEDSSSRSIVKG